MSRGTPLRDAVEALYAAFAAVARPTGIERCPCCSGPDEEVHALLTRVPVRDLPAAALEPYADHALLTWGSVDDFRYFLPRIVELTLGDRFGLGPEAHLGRLRRAGWLSWPDPERSAIRRVLTAWWAQTLVDDAGEADVDTVLGAIGCAEDDLTPYFAVWTAALGQQPAAKLLLDLLLFETRRDRGRWRLANAFWERSDDRLDQWLTDPLTRAAVADAFRTSESERTLEHLAEIDSLLR